MDIQLLDLSCNKCGGPLQVPAGTGYATCAHCGAALQIHAEGGAIYTSLLERIGAHTSRIQEDVQAIRAQNEIERLDKEWEQTHARYAADLEASQGHYTAIVIVIASAIGALMLIASLVQAGENAKALGAAAISVVLFAPAVWVISKLAGGQGRIRQAHTEAWNTYQRKRTELLGRINDFSNESA